MVSHTQRIFRTKTRISPEGSLTAKEMLPPSPSVQPELFLESSRQSQPIRDIPVPESKYTDVWRRLRAKVKSQLFMKRLGLEIQLFGANLMAIPEGEGQNEAMQRIVKKKLERSQTVKEQEEKISPKGLFLPNSPVKNCWSIVYFFLMLYTAYILPYVMAFVDRTQAWQGIEITIDLLFFIDILITINSAYFNQAGMLVTSRKTITLAYLKSWLIVDFVACFPFYLMSNNEESQDVDQGSSVQYKSFIRLARLPRVYRLLRLTRVLKLMKSCQSNPHVEKCLENVCGKGTVIRLMAFMFMISICVHLMTCMWFFVAKVEGLGPDTWVVQKGLRDASVSELYIASLFWTITTLATVGYGDIVPGTSLERLLAIAWMLFGVCFFSFTIGSLANLLNSIDTKESILLTKLSAIDEFASEAKLDSMLKYRLKHALRYAIEQTGFTSSEKRSIFNELPRQLKYEVACAMHQGAAKTLPFFAERDQMFVAAVVPFLSGHSLEDSATVYKEKEYADEIYFIVKGRCNLMIEGKYVLKKLPQGSYFGAIEVIKQIPRKFTITAATRLELLIMNKRLFYSVKTEFPAIYHEMIELAEVRDHLNEKSKEYFLRMLSKMKNAKPVDAESVLSKAPESRIVSPCRSGGSRRTEDKAKYDVRLQQLESMISATQRVANSIFSVVTRHGGIPGKHLMIPTEHLKTPGEHHRSRTMAIRRKGTDIIVAEEPVEKERVDE